MKSPRLTLVVLYGGQSAEHEVSRVSAAHVVAAADPERYDVVCIGIDRDGTWHASPALRFTGAGPREIPGSLPLEGPAVAPGEALGDLADAVVFPVLHGPMGEDGTIQGLLETVGITYAGSGVLASAAAMDKSVANRLFTAAGLEQARYAVLHTRECVEGRLDEVWDELGRNIFVKPVNMGSSIGVTHVRERAGLGPAVAAAGALDEWVIFEEAVKGREIEVAVLGNLEPRASLPGEITPAADFYDYEDKYVDGAATLTVPAPLSPELTDEVRRLAVRAYSALRCEGMARVDFFYEPGGRGFLVNEVNTIPGFTPISMYPRMWDATGLGYAALIDELVSLALERRDRRRRFAG